MSSRLPLLPVQRLASYYLIFPAAPPSLPSLGYMPIPPPPATRKLAKQFSKLCVCVCVSAKFRLLKFIKRKLIRLRSSKTHLSIMTIIYFIDSYRFALRSSRGSFILLGKILKSFKETVHEHVLIDALRRSIRCY